MINHVHYPPPVSDKTGRVYRTEDGSCMAVALSDCSIPEQDSHGGSIPIEFEKPPEWRHIPKVIGFEMFLD